MLSSAAMSSRLVDPVQSRSPAISRKYPASNFWNVLPAAMASWSLFNCKYSYFGFLSALLLDNRRQFSWLWSFLVSKTDMKLSYSWLMSLSITTHCYCIISNDEISDSGQVQARPPQIIGIELKRPGQQVDNWSGIIKNYQGAIDDGHYGQRNRPSGQVSPRQITYRKYWFTQRQ